jgi:hypothetical protein
LPLFKRSNPEASNFLLKRQEPPDEVTLKKNLPKCGEETVNKTRACYGKENIWVSTDETTNAPHNGRVVANIVFGIFEKKKKTTKHYQRNNFYGIAKKYLQ